mmetsp:Transcript_16500/g.47467  ORF Transcript_16500/g.47467 Transcript_16500/m.47467 type:complete len:103 (+) Transcript_16500:622-930(+)
MRWTSGGNVALHNTVLLSRVLPLPPPPRLELELELELELGLELELELGLELEGLELELELGRPNARAIRRNCGSNPKSSMRSASSTTASAHPRRSNERSSTN